MILATSTGVAADLVKRVVPAAGQLLGSIRNAPMVSASLVFSTRDFERPAPRGYGLVSPNYEGSRLLGCLFSSSAFENSSPAGTVLLRIIAGGGRDRLETCETQGFVRRATRNRESEREALP